MAKARLLDSLEDYTRFGVTPGTVEKWEDGRRNLDTGPNNWEWWYFDTILDDGSTAVIQFFTSTGRHLKSKGDHPALTIKITGPDGNTREGRVTVKAKDASFGREQCDVRLGRNTFQGDLKAYHIHVEADRGVGADLDLVSLSQPYRPGTAYFGLGDDHDYYTWLCVVPKGKVSGTLTYAGKVVPVTGFGYHDHQWGNTNLLKEWNNWVWARQSFEDLTMLTFDMISAERTGFVRFPIVFIQNQAGQLVFENTSDVTSEVLEEYDDPASGKVNPRAIRYHFESGGMHVDYTLRVKDIIETKGKNNQPLVARLAMGAVRLNPSYARYLADGALVFTSSGKTIERSGELIFEFMFPGESWHGHLSGFSNQ